MFNNQPAANIETMRSSWRATKFKTGIINMMAIMNDLENYILFLTKIVL